MIVCRTCGRSLPEEAYYTKTSKTVCYDCIKKRQAKYERVKKANPQFNEIQRLNKERLAIEKAKEKEREQTCAKDCQRYPCFRGIDNCKINLALTCVKFNKK